MLCKPKESGGVGIINFPKQNEALLLKHLHKFYNKSDVPWVSLVWGAHYGESVPHAQNLCGSFWWRDIMKLVEKFWLIATIQPGKGNSFLFWEDSWVFAGSTEPLSLRYPRLYSYVLDKNSSATEVYGQQDLLSMFYLPLSSQAYDEFQDLTTKMAMNPLSIDDDKWSYPWGPIFSAARYYRHLHAHLDPMPVSKWIWKSSCMMKIKFFAWLLLNDRLNTKDLLQRRHWQVTSDFSCVLCPGGHHEDRFHLFFQCNFSHRIWTYLQIDWTLSDDLQTAVSRARSDFKQPFFTEVIMLAAWNIWKQRNGKIFEAKRPSFAAWRREFVHDISMLVHRIKTKHQSALKAWIGSLM